MFKIYPSSSGFMLGKSAITQYSSACPRYILAGQNAKRVDIDEEYQQLGLHHEEDQEARLGDQLQDRELVLKGPVMDGVEYSGRLDFLRKDGVIVETKASFSDSMLYDVIKKGKVKINHIAQLVFYMIRRSQKEGILACGYYTKSADGQYIQEGYRDFQVSIDDIGEILVDGNEIGYSVRDQLRHTNEVAKALIDKKIYPRPLNAFSWDSACKTCPMKQVCDFYDISHTYTDEHTPMSVEKFINDGKAAIESQQPVKPRIKIRGSKK